VTFVVHKDAVAFLIDSDDEDDEEEEESMHRKLPTRSGLDAKHPAINSLPGDQHKERKMRSSLRVLTEVEEVTKEDLSGNSCISIHQSLRDRNITIPLRITTVTLEDWKRLKNIRIKALTESPDAFGSTLQDALERPDDSWKLHASDDDVICFIASCPGNILDKENASSQHDPGTIFRRSIGNRPSFEDGEIPSCLNNVQEDCLSQDISLSPDKKGETETAPEGDENRVEEKQEDWIDVGIIRGAPYVCDEGQDRKYGGSSTTAGLYSAWVAPEARGRGIGVALVEALKAWAMHEKSYVRILLHVGALNYTGIRLYASCGFVLTGRKTRMPFPRWHLKELEMVYEATPNDDDEASTRSATVLSSCVSGRSSSDISEQSSNTV
jgi:ribosomal protein S18 acetylase RimI-like enzyme